MRVIILNSLIILSLSAVYNCSSKGEVQVQSNLDTRIDHRAVASLSVEPDERVETTEDVIEEIRRIRTELFGRLVSVNVFAQVVQAGEAAEYDVYVRLLAANEVSQGARILFGVLAGQNELALLVGVFDTSNNTLVVSFTAKGKSASHPLSSENDMDAAIREAVDEVILELNDYALDSSQRLADGLTSVLGPRYRFHLSAIYD